MNEYKTMVFTYKQKEDYFLEAEWGAIEEGMED